MGYNVSMQRPEAIILSSEERAILQNLKQDPHHSRRLKNRARIILMAAQGKTNRDIARALGVSRPTVQLWCKRFLVHRILELNDAPRPGRPPISQGLRQKILNDRANNNPKLSRRSVARRRGVSEATVRRIWKSHDFQKPEDRPFWHEDWERIVDIFALFWAPPDSCLIVLDHKKSTVLRMKIPGAKKHKHEASPTDYKSDQITSLFSALNKIKSQLHDEIIHHHKYREFLIHLKKIDDSIPANIKLNLLVGNQGSPTDNQVRRWLERHPRFDLLEAPATDSWLDFIKDRLAFKKNEKILAASLDSVSDLNGAIKAYLKNKNQKPKAFFWIADLEQIKSQLGRIPK